jgi:protein phosphatase 1 regulatory subunit 10
VTKAFGELKQMERSDERCKFQLSRKLLAGDNMVEQMPWKPLIITENVPVINYGANSLERKIQADREKSVLQSLYFSYNMIPDSAQEPDVEIYSVPTDPVTIPLDDITGNPDAVNDFTNMPWPDAKGSPSHEVNTFGSFPFGQSGPPTMFPPFGQNPAWNMPAVNNAPPHVPMLGFGQMPPVMPNQMNPMGQMSPPINVIPAMFQNNPQNFVPMNNNQPPPPFRTNGPPSGGNGGWVRGDNARDWKDKRDDRDRRDDRDFRGRNNFNNRGNWVNNFGNDRPRGICNQFQAKGYCRNGNNCKYAHVKGSF